MNGLGSEVILNKKTAEEKSLCKINPFDFWSGEPTPIFQDTQPAPVLLSHVVPQGALETNCLSLLAGTVECFRHPPWQSNQREVKRLE